MDRLEGIVSERALGDRHAIHVLDAAHGRPSHGRKSRKEMEPRSTRRIEGRCKLCADIAAQNRIGLLEDGTAATFPGEAYKLCYLCIGSLCIQVAGAGVDREHGRLLVPEQLLGLHGRCRHRNIRRKHADACIKRACQIICDNCHLHVLHPPLMCCHELSVFSGFSIMAASSRNRYNMKRI